MSSLRVSRTIARAIQRSVAPKPLIVSPTTNLITRQSTVQSLLPSRSATFHSRQFSSSSSARKEQAPSSSGIAPPKTYSFQEIQDFASDPSSSRILIDVREPSELLQTGRIPTAKSVPISSAPDAFFMNEEDFEGKFGFPRPSEDTEVIFYCKAGVRSRQAALLAGQARPTFGGKISNYPGSWVDWEQNGGNVEKEGDQKEPGVVSSGGAPATPRP